MFIFHLFLDTFSVRVLLICFEEMWKNRFHLTCKPECIQVISGGLPMQLWKGELDGENVSMMMAIWQIHMCCQSEFHRVLDRISPSQITVGLLQWSHVLPNSSINKLHVCQSGFWFKRKLKPTVFETRHVSCHHPVQYTSRCRQLPIHKNTSITKWNRRYFLAFPEIQTTET